MNTTIVASRPSTYRQLIEQSLKLYNNSFPKIILLAFLIGVTTFLPNIIYYFTGLDLNTVQKPTIFDHLLMFLITAIDVGLFVAILWHMHCELRRRREPLEEDFQMGMKKALLVMIATVVQVVFIFGFALLTMVIPLILYKLNLLAFDNSLLGILTFLIFFTQICLLFYVTTWFVFLTPIIATENKSIIKSLGHSISLGWNHWWEIFSLQITPWLIYLLLLMFLRFIVGLNLHIYLLEYKPYSFLGTILHVIIFMFFVPWVAALLLVQLHDLELRKKIAIKNES